MCAEIYGLALLVKWTKYYVTECHSGILERKSNYRHVCAVNCLNELLREDANISPQSQHSDNLRYGMNHELIA
jgi:hypothetical protein